VGKDPLCYRHLRANWSGNVPGLSILDFGAGRYAHHAKKLWRRGYDVTAYEFGDNIDLGIHTTDALDFVYDLVIASNVLNVQSDERMLTKTLREISGALEPGGVLICNYPSSPRYAGISVESMERRLRARFTIKRVGGTPSSPVWQCVKRSQRRHNG
jgi:SAM-dependent methyltransferase